MGTQCIGVGEFSRTVSRDTPSMYLRYSTRILRGDEVVHTRVEKFHLKYGGVNEYKALIASQIRRTA